MEDARRDTLRELEGVPDEALDWAPDARTNTIATLLYHIALIEDDWLFADALEAEDHPMRPRNLFPFPDRVEGWRLTPVTGFTMEEHLERLVIVRGLPLELLRPMTRTSIAYASARTTTSRRRGCSTTSSSTKPSTGPTSHGSATLGSTPVPGWPHLGTWPARPIRSSRSRRVACTSGARPTRPRTRSARVAIQVEHMSQEELDPPRGRQSVAPAPKGHWNVHPLQEPERSTAR